MFQDLKLHIGTIGGFYIARMVAYVVVLAILAGLWFRFRRRFSARVRHVGLAVLVILAVRFVLFYNPAAWSFYLARLTANDVGFRQITTMLFYELGKFEREFHPPTTDVVAVGSSQTHSLYGTERREEPFSFDAFSLAGMSPLGLMLYREHIAEVYRPRHILLFVSEFDLAKRPETETLQYAPYQGLSTAALYKRLKGREYTTSLGKTFLHKLTGDLFPEHKYAFIFKGLANKALGRKRAMAVRNIDRATDAERLEVQVDQLKQLHAEWIDVNFELLRDYVGFWAEREVDVIIVAGQFHPHAYTEANVEMNEKIDGMLRRLAKENQAVHYIPRDELPVLRAEDYTDGLHVRDEVSKRFVDEVFGYLLDNGLVDTK